MNIATVILTHDHVNLTNQLVKSIKKNVGKDYMVLVDKPGYHKFKTFPNAHCGFHHAYYKSPYRNYALGIKLLYDKFPKADWYLYTEYDAYFVSEAFKEDLKKADELGCYMAGIDLRRFHFEFPEISKIVKMSPPKFSYYFLGCVHFLKNNFVEKLRPKLDLIINKTKHYTKGFFPNYNRWAFEEELYPTLATMMGGKLYELSCYKSEDGEYQKIKDDENMIYAGKDHDLWRGKYKKYTIRNSPNIQLSEIHPEASIIHPVKDDTLARQKLIKMNKTSLRIH